VGRLRTKLYDKRDYFNFPVLNFIFICSNIPAVSHYGVYISRTLYGHHHDIKRVVASVTRRVPHVEQELLTILGHLNSSPEFRGVRVVFISCVVLCTSLFALLRLAIALTVILRFTVSDGETGGPVKRNHRPDSSH
jgi:hypothetical protein